MTISSTPVPTVRSPDYDAFAGFYHRYWTHHYHDWALRVLDQLVLRELAPGAHVLDVCCGVGTISGALVERGFRVTGLDLSESMLNLARADVPGAEFLHADVRAFRVPAAFDAAVCAFDSLNHLVDDGDLAAAFANVAAALVPGAPFVFDVTTEQAYLTQWNNSCSVVDADTACFIRGQYNPDTSIGGTEITLFRFVAGWERADLSFQHRCYPAAQIKKLLAISGFDAVTAHDARTLPGLDHHLAEGRLFFVAHRQASPAALAQGKES